MKQYISHQKARSLVSAMGWSKVRSGFLWPVGLTTWLGWSGSYYYLVEYNDAP